jgi:hypothetical protein
MPYPFVAPVPESGVRSAVPLACVTVNLILVPAPPFAYVADVTRGPTAVADVNPARYAASCPTRDPARTLPFAPWWVSGP